MARPGPCTGPAALQSCRRPRRGSIARKSKRRTGTTLRYTDTGASTTAFDVLKAAPGIKRRGRCVAPPPGRRVTRGTRCTRYLALGRFSHRDRAGQNRFHFTGRMRGRRLAAGRYRLQATPRLPGTAGRVATTTFRITR